MASTPIRAVDQRAMPLAAEGIWPVLADVPGYVAWYPSSLNLRVLGVTADRVGSEVEICPRGGRPFRCRVESLDPPRRLCVRYPGDFITGTGEWRLEPTTVGTLVTYEMNVVAHGRLAAWLGKLLPLGRLHSRLMRHVLENLEREAARRSRG